MSRHLAIGLLLLAPGFAFAESIDQTACRKALVWELQELAKSDAQAEEPDGSFEYQCQLTSETWAEQFPECEGLGLEFESNCASATDSIAISGGYCCP